MEATRKILHYLPTLRRSQGQLETAFVSGLKYKTRSHMAYLQESLTSWGISAEASDPLSCPPGEQRLSPTTTHCLPDGVLVSTKGSESHCWPYIEDIVNFLAHLGYQGGLQQKTTLTSTFWDVEIVLQYLKRLGDNETLSDWHLLCQLCCYPCHLNPHIPIYQLLHMIVNKVL